MLTGSDKFGGWDGILSTTQYLTFSTTLNPKTYTSMGCIDVASVFDNVLQYEGDLGGINAYTYDLSTGIATWATDTQRIELISVENISPEFAKWFRENFTIATDNPT